ncbi:hypothetical protein OGATHE_002683 [Ogataea polymorpha]|uniref:Uncharacterized protein n=1 Tax=Ogataea polymorpha TaxID=460523 RepID=A0A9P8T8G5_9ASCO|nr:hypothetical protein OGATHE_002683 [Ogataea polymorpha]
MEDLRVSLGILFVINQKLTSNHNKNVSIFGCRLSIKGGNSVSHLVETKGCEFFNDVASTLDLGRLKSEHRVVSLNVVRIEFQRQQMWPKIFQNLKIYKDNSLEKPRQHLIEPTVRFNLGILHSFIILLLVMLNFLQASNQVSCCRINKFGSLNNLPTKENCNVQEDHQIVVKERIDIKRRNEGKCSQESNNQECDDKSKNGGKWLQLGDPGLQRTCAPVVKLINQFKATEAELPSCRSDKHAKQVDSAKPTIGTPFSVVMLKNFGARPLLARANIDLDPQYMYEFPAE